MKKIILILSLILLAVSFQSCKAQNRGNFFWSYPQTSGLGYGALYNWYAASSANFAPAGWHVPSKTEWETLRQYCDPSGVAGNNIAGSVLKTIGTYYWRSPNTGALNSVGFNAKGGAYRIYNTGAFFTLKEMAEFASSTASNSTIFYSMTLSYGNEILAIGGESKVAGASVRLIKDNSTDPITLTDYDGNVYSTVTIGTQVWISSNWKCEHLNDGTAIPIVTDNTTWIGLTTMGMCYYNNQPLIYK